MTIAEIRQRLINEAQLQDREAAKAAQRGDAKWEALHKRTAHILRIRADALGDGK